MKTSVQLKVIFYHVKDNAEKIKFIYTKAQESFQQERRLLIAVPNFQAAQYVDHLLWRFPEEGFLPHVITDANTQEWIAITTQDQCNINQAICLLNLCHVPSLLSHQVEETYDLYDASNPQKLEISKQRLQHYQSKGFNVKTEGKPI